MDMKKLMCPKSIVVIGASDKPGMTGRATLAAIHSAIADHVYLLNPKRDELYGYRCYHALKELPEIVDCMVLATPAPTVVGYLEEGGAMGIGAAVVIASGFGEERSAQAQHMAQEVEAVCVKYDIALCGPNCVGILNGLDRTAPGAHSVDLMLKTGSDGGMAVVAQSGYLTGGFCVPDATQLSYLVSAGNCTICTIEDYMCYFAEDDRVTCIAAYIEGVRKPQKLVQALRTAALKRKPVVVLKAGMSEKGSFAAASHTGSIAGDYMTYKAVFKKFGVILTETAQEFVTTARMFSVLRGRWPKKAGVCGINFSGGENTQCADNCARFGIELPAFSQQTAAALAAVLPSYSTPSNPLDATTTLFSETEKVRTLLSAISQDENIGLITLGSDVGINSEAKDITCVNLMRDMEDSGVLLPAVVIPTFEKNRSPEIYHQFEQAHVPVLSTGELAFRSIRHLMDFAAFDPSIPKLELALPTETADTSRIALSEADSKAELVPYGVRVPAQALAADIQSLNTCLDQVGFPAAMKVESPDILHKTDAGAVRLNISTQEDAQAAFNEIIANCKKYAPDARVYGVMVQEMVPKGVEIILGVKNDRQFGPMLLVGLGGIFVELFHDVSLYPCPLSFAEARGMLQSLKGYRLLTGYRGSKPCDVDALVELMVKISDYAVAHTDSLAELDLNPVFVYEDGKGVCVADALVVKRQQQR